MGNPYSAQIADAGGGAVKVAGDLTFTDPANQPGGSSPQTRAYYQGSPVTIGNSALGVLTWDTKLVGDALLDISIPGAPTVVTAGVYAFTVQVAPTAGMTAGGVYITSLDLDYNGDDAGTNASSPGANAIQPAPVISLTLTYYVPAGGLVRIGVTNNDGVNGHDFFLAEGVVQRLS